MFIDYMTAVLRNEISICAIDDYIDMWHKGEYICQLNEFLGMTMQEYALFVENENNLPKIIECRRNSIG